MSVQAMTWALQQQRVTDPTERHVLLCLANYADADGDSMFPSIEALCRDTGRSERTVQYTLRALQAAGVIARSNPALAAAKIRRGDKRPTVYRLCMACGEPAPEGPSRGAMVAPREVTGCKQRPNGVQPIAPDPSVNHQEEESLSAAARAKLDEKSPAAPFPPGWKPCIESLALCAAQQLVLPTEPAEQLGMVAAFAGHMAGRSIEPHRIPGEFLKWAGRWLAFEARDQRVSATLTDQAGEAALAWAEVRAAVGRGMRKPKAWKYPRTEQALQGMGGFALLADLGEFNARQKQREFSAAFMAVA